jgi:hypothetical protein
MALDEEIDRLYGLPLPEFTAARNALAKELRGAGDQEGADRVKSLRKPTAAAGALNRAVRQSPERLAEFLEAARGLREAHEALLEGGAREAVEQATGRERRAAAALADEAERAADGGAGLRDKVDGTLRAAVGDEEARAELEAGRLLRERQAVGLGPLAAAPSRPKRAGGRRQTERDLERAARRELKEARERQKRSERRLRDARQSVAAARERAEAAAEALDRAVGEEQKAQAAADETAADAQERERRLE